MRNTKKFRKTEKSEKLLFHLLFLPNAFNYRSPLHTTQSSAINTLKYIKMHFCTNIYCLSNIWGIFYTFFFSHLCNSWTLMTCCCCLIIKFASFIGIFIEFSSNNFFSNFSIVISSNFSQQANIFHHYISVCVKGKSLCFFCGNAMKPNGKCYGYVVSRFCPQIVVFLVSQIAGIWIGVFGWPSTRFYSVPWYYFKINLIKCYIQSSTANFYDPIYAIIATDFIQ